jgi:hypothetical protein
VAAGDEAVAVEDARTVVVAAVGVVAGVVDTEAGVTVREAAAVGVAAADGEAAVGVVPVGVAEAAARPAIDCLFRPRQPCVCPALPNPVRSTQLRLVSQTSPTHKIHSQAFVPVVG